MGSSTKAMTSPNGRSGRGGLSFTVFFPGHFTRAHLTTRGLLRSLRSGSSSRLTSLTTRAYPRRSRPGNPKDDRAEQVGDGGEGKAAGGLIHRGALEQRIEPLGAEQPLQR